jgi:transmembrane sensor
MIDISKDIGDPESASDWLIALREQPDDPALEQRFQAWLSADPGNRVEWDQTKRTAMMLAAIYDQEAEDMDDSAQKSGDPSNAPRRSAGSRHRSRAVGFGLGLAFALLLAIVAVDPFSSSGDYETHTAESREVLLQDRSEIVLAPNSSMSVSFTSDSRTVSLYQGRAYFSVTSDQSRPFVVKAGAMEVTVHGTAFEVDLEKGGYAVSVADGLVSVAAPGLRDSLNPLRPGEQLVLQASGDWKHSTLSPERIASWRRNQLIAENDRLDWVLDELSHYFKGYILVADDTLADQMVTGVFDLQHPERALNVMARSHGFHVRKLSPWILVVSRD